MKISKEAKDLLELYTKEKCLPELENKQRSLILEKFSYIFPEIEKKTISEKKKLIDLWLDVHVAKYFHKMEDYNAKDWKGCDIHIPINGSVSIRPEIEYLMSIPIIRRCNAIKQLSTAYTIYPGAKHTRDEHQIGTLSVMKKFCKHLLEEKAIKEVDQLTLEVAALIHDVAHPPLGHSLDSIKDSLISRSPLSSIYKYEKKIDKALLEIYLTDDTCQLKWAIESIPTINHELLKSMLLENHDKADQFSPAYTDLIDSEIDADRIDYLSRDAIHTGKKCTFDQDYIIQNSHFCHLKEEDLFIWDEIPKSDRRRFLEFIRQNYGIDWVNKANIDKIDGENIKVYSKENYLSLKINQYKTKVNLKIDDGRVDEFILKLKNGRQNIYKEGNKTRISLGYNEKIDRDLTTLLTFRKNMYEEIYENEEKVIFDEIMVHIIYSTFSLYYGSHNDEITKKFLLLTDCELNEFLKLFSPPSIFNLYDSQFNNKSKYSLIKKYDLYDESSDFSRALREAVLKYSKLFGFKLKFENERRFSEYLKIMSDKDENHTIPPILFSLPHYIPSQKEENYEREAKKKGGLKDIVLRKSDGCCGYFTDVSPITKEKDPSLNKFLLIGKDKMNQKEIIDNFEEFIIKEHGVNIT